MERLKKIYQGVSDLFEVYLPCVSFVVVFVTYVIMIAYRYIFNAQINWIYELSMIAFVWTVVLAASYGSRTDDHIVFTMLYDLFPERGRAVFRIAGNLVIVIIMSILLPRAIDAVSFLSIKKSSLMKIPFNIIYAPFIVFNVLTIVHHALKIAKDVYGLFRSRGEDAS